MPCFLYPETDYSMQAEPTYRIRNWPEYNRALIQRGSITIWIDEKAVKNWFSSYHTGRAGRPATYSDEAILMMLVLREVYKRSLRNLQGFVQSLFHAMGLDLPVPSYSQVSRRAKSLHRVVNRLTEERRRVTSSLIQQGSKYMEKANGK